MHAAHESTRCLAGTEALEGLAAALCSSSVHDKLLAALSEAALPSKALPSTAAALQQQLQSWQQSHAEEFVQSQRCLQAGIAAAAESDRLTAQLAR